MRRIVNFNSPIIGKFANVGEKSRWHCLAEKKRRRCGIWAVASRKRPHRSNRSMPRVRACAKRRKRCERRKTVKCCFFIFRANRHFFKSHRRHQRRRRQRFRANGRAAANAAASRSKSDKIALGEKLKGVIEAYSFEYNLLNGNGAGLLRCRERTGGLLEMAEALINRIADRSDSFGADISEIRVHRTDFKAACDFAQDDLRAAQTSAINAGDGILGGVAVAALMPATVMRVATAFGTASTGARISTLSGTAGGKQRRACMARRRRARGGRRRNDGRERISRACRPHRMDNRRRNDARFGRFVRQQKVQNRQRTQRTQRRNRIRPEKHACRAHDQRPIERSLRENVRSARRLGETISRMHAIVRQKFTPTPRKTINCIRERPQTTQKRCRLRRGQCSGTKPRRCRDFG